jgi:hypothetical protein
MVIGGYCSCAESKDQNSKGIERYHDRKTHDQSTNIPQRTTIALNVSILKF